MSSKLRILTLVLALILAIGMTHAVQADVTGSFGTHISLHAVTGEETEIQPLEFDVQNALNLTVAISGLSTTIHSHFGLAGVEDVQFTYAATLGALDLEGTAVFGRFLGYCADLSGPSCLDVENNITPVSDELLFIKKRVKLNLSLGGVNFSNLAMFEDTNFRMFEALVFGPGGIITAWLNVSGAGSEQAFAFGDVLSLSGQTPSGVTVEAETGICAERTPNVIKKHSWPYRVNPHCAEKVVTDVGITLEDIETALFNTGVVEAAGFERDTPTGDPIMLEEVQPFTPETISTANASIAVSESARDCSTSGEFPTTATCSKTLSLTNNGPEDALVNFSLFGETSAPDINNIQCGAATTSNNNQTMRLANGESATCTWTAELVIDDTYVTSVQIVSNPDEIEAITDIGDAVLDVTKADKPGLFFDFETLSVSGVPLASGLTGDATLTCTYNFDCSLTNTLNFSGMGPVPVEFSFDIVDVTTFEFGGFDIVLSSGVGTFTISDTDADADIDEVNAVVSATLNPDTNPATVNFDAVIEPGTGFTDFDASIGIERSGLSFGATVDFTPSGSGTAEFNQITFDVGTSAGVFSVNSTATFTETGFGGSDTTFTLSF